MTRVAFCIDLAYFIQGKGDLMLGVFLLFERQVKGHLFHQFLSELEQLLFECFYFDLLLHVLLLQLMQHFFVYKLGRGLSCCLHCVYILIDYFTHYLQVLLSLIQGLSHQPFSHLFRLLSFLLLLLALLNSVLHQLLFLLANALIQLARCWLMFFVGDGGLVRQIWFFLYAMVAQMFLQYQLFAFWVHPFGDYFEYMMMQMGLGQLVDCLLMRIILIRCNLIHENNIMATSLLRFK